MFDISIPRRSLGTVAAFAACGALSSVAAPWAEVHTTTAEAMWTEGARAAEVGATARKLSVPTDRTDQPVEGFGTALSELGWRALSKLSEGDRAAALDALFAPGCGACLSVVRLPLGSSDFSSEYFSYDDTPGDFALEDFSIARDERNLVPLVREVQKRVGNDLRVWSSPWTPPKWMKACGRYAGVPKPGVNDATEETRFFPGENAFIMEPRYLEAYARYFRRYVDAYRAIGIPIWMVMPQNEYLSPQVWQSCTWRNDSLVRFVADYLGPALEGSGTEIFFGTMDRLYSYEGFDIAMHDAAARKYVRGGGFQWGGLGAMGAAHRRYPEMFLMCSEQQCHDGANDWKDARLSWKLLRDNFLSGSRLHTYWNIALEPRQASPWGWAQDSLITVDPATRTYRLNPDYFILRHLSAFVRRGARRIVTDGYRDAVAFVNPDGSVVVAAGNESAAPVELEVTVDGIRRTAVLPPDSVQTLVTGNRTEEGK